MTYIYIYAIIIEHSRRIIVSVSTNVRTNYFSGNRLLFTPSATDTAISKKALEKGIRIANIVQRALGKSTAVRIDGKLIHLNTNSLNKYHTTVIKSTNTENSTAGKVSKLTNRIRKMICTPLEKAGTPLSKRAIATLYGSALCSAHLNDNENSLRLSPSPELAEAVRRSISPQSDSINILKEAKERLAEAEKALKLAQFKRSKADIKEAFNYLNTEVKVEFLGLINLVKANKEAIIKKMEATFVEVCIGEEVTRDHIEQVIGEAKGMVSDVLNKADIAYKDTQETLRRMSQTLLESPEEGSGACRTLDLIASVFDLLIRSAALLNSFEATVQTATVLHGQINRTYDIFMKAPPIKSSLPRRLKGFISRKVASMTLSRKEGLYEQLKADITSGFQPVKKGKLSAWFEKVISNVVLEDPNVTLQELKRLTLQTVSKEMEKRAASDTVLVDANKEYLGAKKALENIQNPKLSIVEKVKRGLSGARSVSKNRLAPISDQVRIGATIQPGVEAIKLRVNSGRASPDSIAPDNQDSDASSLNSGRASPGNQSSDAIYLNSDHARADSPSPNSVDSGKVDDDGDLFFDALDGMQPASNPNFDSLGLD